VKDVVRIAKPASAPVIAWSGKVWMAVRAGQLPASAGNARDAVLVVAGLLWLVGDINDLSAQEAHRAFCTLLVGLRRSSQWRDAVAQIPATREAVLNLSQVVHAYEARAAAGYFESLTTAAGVRLADVVRGIVRVGASAESFFDAVQDKWYRHPNRVFSDATFEEVGKLVRGKFGAYHPDDHERHAREIMENVHEIG